MSQGGVCKSMEAILLYLIDMAEFMVFNSCGV